MADLTADELRHLSLPDLAYALADIIGEMYEAQDDVIRCEKRIAVILAAMPAAMSRRHAELSACKPGTRPKA